MKNHFRRSLGNLADSLSRVIGVGSMPALLAVALTGAPLSGGTLTGVRLGMHPDHTRVVFDCRGPVRAGEPFVDSRGLILVPFPGAEVDLGQAAQPVRGFAVTAVELIEWPSMPVARIQVGSRLRHVRIFRLSSPDRVVLDLFTEEDLNPEVRPSSPLASAADSPARWGESAGTGGDPVGRGLPHDAREASAGGSFLVWTGWDTARLQTAILLTVAGLSGATLLLLWSFARRAHFFGQPDFAERAIPLERLRNIDARIRKEFLRLERMSDGSRDQ
jgi:hypothetical protein